MIKAEVVAHSKSPQGHELVSILATFPRIILAEVNTHRMLSKNTSSSRAIPFKKMVQSVKDNPFIPIAWQKDHPGMQGSEYLNPDRKVSLDDFIVILYDSLNTYPKDSEEYAKLQVKLQERVELVETILSEYRNKVKSLNEWWLFARDKAVEMATILYVLNVTKQLCNRLLETFMWTTMLITGNLKDGGWDNFFDLRCPQYTRDDKVYKSKKDFIKGEQQPYGANMHIWSDLDWLYINKGLAEIHMMALAECIYDAINESTPRELKAGEWHIPFSDKIITYDNPVLKEAIGKTPDRVKISTAMGARTSYTIVGDEKVLDFKALIALDDRLLNQWPPHSSPMEHCSVAMNEYEYYNSGKQYPNTNPDVGTGIIHTGWCRNFRGFIPRRHLIETANGS